MHRIKFIHQPSADKDRARGLNAILASCAFHGVLFGSAVAFGLLYSWHLPPIKSGSAPGASVISLETMIITSPPPRPPTPVPPTPVSPTPAPPAPPTPRQLVALPKLPSEGVPFFAIQTNKATPVPPTKAHTTTSVSPAKQKTASALSSYAPGVNELPHPPYPSEARERGETGVVVINVEFDGKGDVSQVEVARSSGVPILDSETRTYIRAHWHSATYAGQTISQPVEYSLENL